MYYHKSDEYKNLNDKVFDVLLSCKTVEQFKSAKNYIDLVEKYMLKEAFDDYDRMIIFGFTSFRRGFCAGMIQNMEEERRKNSVLDYLSLM